MDSLAGHYLIVADRETQKRSLQKTFSYVSDENFQHLAGYFNEFEVFFFGEGYLRPTDATLVFIGLHR